MHSERWVGALTVPGAVGSGVVWEKGSQGGCTGLGAGLASLTQGGEPSLAAQAPVPGVQVRCHNRAQPQNPVGVPSLGLWRHRDLWLCIPVHLGEGATFSWSLHPFSGHTIFGTTAIPNPAPIWGATVLPCTAAARPSHPPPALGARCKPKAESHGLGKGLCLRFLHLGSEGLGSG